MGSIFNSFGQKKDSDTNKFQFDINLGYVHWITPDTYNKGLSEVPLSLNFNIQKNIKHNMALTVGMDIIRAQEEFPFDNSFKQEMGPHYTILSEIGVKFYWGNKVIFFTHPQIGISLVRFPELTAKNEITQYSAERTVTNALGLSLSAEIGAEFKINTKTYFQPTISVSTSSVSGDYELSEQYSMRSSETTNWSVVSYRNSILIFSIGLGKYF